jgi:hypothetical protein
MAVVVATFTAEPAIAKLDCHDPQDFAQYDRCFLAQFACLGPYFGIEQPYDYPKALKCFETRKILDFVVMMYINGEGVPRDLHKAKTLLKTGQQTDSGDLPPDKVGVLQKAIHKCEHAPHKSCPRVDYCQDVAYTTQEGEICDAIYELHEEELLNRTIAEVKMKLSASDNVVFDRAVAEFKAHQLDEDAARVR